MKTQLKPVRSSDLQTVWVSSYAASEHWIQTSWQASNQNKWATPIVDNIYTLKKTPPVDKKHKNLVSSLEIPTFTTAKRHSPWLYYVCPFSHVPSLSRNVDRCKKHETTSLLRLLETPIWCRRESLQTACSCFSIQIVAFYVEFNLHVFKMFTTGEQIVKWQNILLQLLAQCQVSY